MQAGLPPPFWDLAAVHACVSHNITTDQEGNCPWFQKNKQHFKGMHIPFGALVKFIPNSTAELGKALPRFAPTGVDGVFLGYELRRGNQWSKGYKVAPLSELVNVPYNIFAWPERCKVQILVGELTVVEPDAGEVSDLTGRQRG